VQLDCTTNDIRDLGLQALTASTHFGSLRRLVVCNSGITATGAASLASSPLFDQLDQLDLGHNGLSNAGLRALVGSRVPRDGPLRLSELRLPMTDLNSLAIATLAQSRQLANLRTLVLAGNPISDTGAAALAESPYLVGLTQLDLRGTHIGAGGKQQLQDRFGNGVLF
jgi:Leucine-rich repeat (LRR) protein